MKALILAAGKGTRLMPYTQHLPKCLMPVKGHPLLGFWISKLKAAGISDVLINTHYLAEIVQGYLQSLEDVSITIVYESNLLGTAGTIRQNYVFYKGSRLLVIHGDNWCNCDLDGLLYHHLNQRPKQCLITMMTFITEDPESCGIVEKDEDGILVSFHEKVKQPPSNEANAAIYVLEPEVVDFIFKNPMLSDFSVELVPLFLGKISCWPSNAIHRDIGTIKNLLLAQKDSFDNHSFLAENEMWMANYRKNLAYLQINHLNNTLEDSGSAEKLIDKNLTT